MARSCGIYAWGYFPLLLIILNFIYLGFWDVIVIICGLYKIEFINLKFEYKKVTILIDKIIQKNYNNNSLLTVVFIA